MNKFFLDDSVYNIDANSVNLMLENNIVMRSFRKDIDLESEIGEDWERLNFIEQAAVRIAYEHGSVRTRELSEAVDNYSMSSVRNALKHLMAMGVFERVASAPTSPNQ